MQVIVNARHTRVPESLKRMATEKIEKVQRIFDRITKVEIEFSEEHNPRVSKKHVVEVTLSTKAHVLRAVGKGVDPTSAVDAVVDKLEAQVKRMKGKMIRRGKGRTETIRMPKRSNNTDRVDSARASGPRVRRAGRFSVEPMTPKEAALEMDSTGGSFLPFVNAETDLVSVVYRMDDGSYGLIEPAGA